jgi:hypothetical protein
MESITERINNPPRLVQCIQALNEGEFITQVMGSIYNEVDVILVIEGAVANHPKATKDGHSLDDTVAKIEAFKRDSDPDNKVRFISIKKPWKNLEELKQMFLSMSCPGDWIIINDADEFFKPEDIRRVRQAISLNPYAVEFVPNFLHFYGDMRHVAVPGPEWQPQHQRIFKYTQGMIYNSHPVVTDSENQCTYFSAHYQMRRVMLDRFFIYHYGYARQEMDARMVEKQEYYEKELAAHGGANVQFDEKVKAWTENTEPVLEFDGEHPVGIAPSDWRLTDTKGTLVGNWRDDAFYSKVLAGEEYGNIWLCMTKQSQPHMNHYHNGMVTSCGSPSDVASDLESLKDFGAGNCKTIPGSC